MKQYVQLFEDFRYHRRRLHNIRDVEKWLNEKDIRYYTLRSEDDGYYVDVDGDVFIQEHMDHIPVRFGKVTGRFIAHIPYLKSLYNFPQYVGGSCRINISTLTTLEYAPSYIGGEFGCYNTSTLITSGYDGTINKGKFTKDIEMSLDERTEKFIHYLENYSFDVNASVLWLNKVDPKLYEQMFPELLKYSEDNIIGLTFSDDIKNIASAALKGNHKLR